MDETTQLRAQVDALNEANQALKARLRRVSGVEEVTATGTEELFALRRRVIELGVENRELMAEVMAAHPMEPPVPATPTSGFAFGISDAAGPREVVVAGDFAKLGKHPSSKVLLEGARPFHAVIERDGDVTIIDLGTNEGTFVNGTRIQAKTKLASGDRLKIGDAQIIVVFGRA